MIATKEKQRASSNFETIYTRNFDDQEVVSIQKSKITDLIIKKNFKVGFAGNFETEKTVYYRIADLDNINLPKIYASDSKNKTLYLRNIRGQHIMDICNRETHIDDQEKLKIILQVINGIQGLHAKGVANLDLNGKNVIMDRTVLKGHVTLVDFDGAGLNSIDYAVTNIDTYPISNKIMFQSAEEVCRKTQSCAVFSKPPEIRVKKPCIDGERADLYGFAGLLTGIYFGYDYLRRAIEINCDNFQIVNREKLHKSIDAKTNITKLVRDFIYTCYATEPDQRNVKFAHMKEILNDFVI